MDEDQYIPNDLTIEVLDNKNNFDKLIKELKSLKKNLLNDFPLDLVAPGHYTPLDLESRKEDALRQFKHIHVNCIPLVKRYKSCSKIKILNLIDGFIDSYKNSNHLICCFLARYSIELNSIVYRIRNELIRLHKSDDNDWLTKGQSFFWLVFRANWGSRQESFKKIMRKYETVSKDKTFPLDLNKSMQTLSGNKLFESLSEEYDFFSEYVHHNIHSINVNISDHQKIDQPFFKDGMFHQPGHTIEMYRYPQKRHHRILNIALFSFKKHIIFLSNIILRLFQFFLIS